MDRTIVYVYPEYGTHSIERRSFSTKQRADKFIKRLCRRRNDVRVHVEQGDTPQ